MVVTGTCPTVRQRELGKRLRELRSQHDLTIEDVADKLLCSATKISRMEIGGRRPSFRDVRDLCVLYSADEAASTEPMRLAKGARRAGWWMQYEDLNPVLLGGLPGNQCLERRAGIARYREVDDYLRDAGFNPQDSLSLVTETGAAYISAVRGSDSPADHVHGQHGLADARARSRVRDFGEEVRPRVTGSYRRRLAALEREEAERREREEDERRERAEAERRERERAKRNGVIVAAARAAAVIAEVAWTLVREHVFKGTGPGRLL